MVPFRPAQGPWRGQVSVIDSKDGHGSGPSIDGGNLVRKFDDSASWWTKGPDLTMQMEMAKRTSYARRVTDMSLPKQREPVLGCTRPPQRTGLGLGRHVFTDNGSTAIEVALEKALRTHLISKHGEGCLVRPRLRPGQGRSVTEERIPRRHAGLHEHRGIFNGPAQFAERGALRGGPGEFQPCRRPLTPRLSDVRARSVSELSRPTPMTYLRQNDGVWSITLPDGRGLPSIQIHAGPLDVGVGNSSTASDCTEAEAGPAGTGAPRAGRAELDEGGPGRPADRAGLPGRGEVHRPLWQRAS